MLVSPAERPPFTSLGPTSSIPETVGADFLIHSPLFGVVGVQRKEVTDLVASLSDDSLAREVIQMKELDVAIWLIEGKMEWSSDGRLLSQRSPFTREQYLGLIFSLSSQGFWMFTTTSIKESMSLLSSLEKWLQKPSHHSLNHRQTARGMFGKPDTTEWQIHFLQGLPGIGYERARDIVRFYNGMPVQLRPDVQLTDVDGIGSKTATRIKEILSA